MGLVISGTLDRSTTLEGADGNDVVGAEDDADDVDARKEGQEEEDAAAPEEETVGGGRRSSAAKRPRHSALLKESLFGLDQSPGTGVSVCMYT